MWIIIAVILAFNSIWLLKINKDLAQVNDELIMAIKNTVEDNEYKIPVKPVTDEQKKLLKKWYEDNKED